MWVADVHDRGIHAHAATARSGEHAVVVGVVGAEGVQRQRLVSLVDESDRLVEGVDRDDRQDRPEDLFSHHRVGTGDADEHGGSDVAGIGIAEPSDRNRAAVEQLLQAVEVRVVDDAGEVGTPLRIVAVELVNPLAQLFDQSIVHVTFDEHVIGSDARLACVHELAPGESTGCHLQVGVSADDRWALATQLECDRCEVLGCGSHHDSSDAPVPGVQDVIEALRQQLGGLGHAAEHQRHGGFAELCDQCRDRIGRAGRELAGFAHHGVAGRDRRDHRQQQELDRVVPWSDHTRDAQRFTLDPRRARLKSNGRGHLLRRHPAIQLSEGVIDVGHQEADLGGPCFERGLAEVGRQRLEQDTLVRHQQFAQPAQRLDAPAPWSRRATGERPTSAVDGDGDLGDRCDRGGGECGAHAERLRRASNAPSRHARRADLSPLTCHR